MKPTENTMSTAFETRPLVEQSFMQRLLRQYPVENAVIELNNLLATRPIQSIMSSDLAEIEQRYGVPLQRFTLNLEEFYAVHLNYQLSNQCLSRDNLADLAHLCLLFQLSAQSIDMLHARIGEIAYRKRIENAVQDGQITQDEKKALIALQAAIGMPSELADAIYKEVCQAHLDRLVQSMGAHARITLSDDQRIQHASKQLGVSLSAEARRAVDRYKRYWTIENQSLPIVKIDIALPKAEQCHFRADGIEWYEERATTRRTGYDDHYEYGKSLDEIDLHSNSTSIQKETFPIIKRISTGILYLTNRRLMVEGNGKVTSVKLNTIHNIKAYKQGVIVDKLTGRRMILLMSRDADSLTLLVQRLLSNTTCL